MIGTSKKKFDEILAFLKGKDRVCIIGCGDCAATCQTGGEKQVLETAEMLTRKGSRVVCQGVVEVACDKRRVKKFLREHRKDIAGAEAILVLSCGSGVQTVAGCTDAVVLPGLDSLFIGEIENLSRFHERCSVCGECILAETAAICPVTRCAKGLVNGPCGGSDQGKCEADRENDCVWNLIYERLKKTGQLQMMLARKKPKSHKPAHRPRRIEIRRS